MGPACRRTTRDRQEPVLTSQSALRASTASLSVKSSSLPQYTRSLNSPPSSRRGRPHRLGHTACRLRPCPRSHRRRHRRRSCWHPRHRSACRRRRHHAAARCRPGRVRGSTPARHRAPSATRHARDALAGQPLSARRAGSSHAPSRGMTRPGPRRRPGDGEFGANGAPKVPWSRWSQSRLRGVCRTTRAGRGLSDTPPPNAGPGSEADTETQTHTLIRTLRVSGSGLTAGAAGAGGCGAK